LKPGSFSALIRPISLVEETDPTKQGLKPRTFEGDATTPRGRRDRSNKTRIETGRRVSMGFTSRVEETDPTKQGLKQQYRNNLVNADRRSKRPIQQNKD